MIPVLQLNSTEQEKKSSENSRQDYEIVFEAELNAIKDIHLVPSTKCLEQLFEKLDVEDKVTQR